MIGKCFENEPLYYMVLDDAYNSTDVYQFIRVNSKSGNVNTDYFMSLRFLMSATREITYAEFIEKYKEVVNKQIEILQTAHGEVV